MKATTLHTLISLRHRIAHLKALASTSLSAVEQHAVQDSLAQAYDRAAYMLAQEGMLRAFGADAARTSVSAAKAKNRTPLRV
jgi:actin-like ATPase involved in cell morphogenesis